MSAPIAGKAKTEAKAAPSTILFMIKPLTIIASIKPSRLHPKVTSDK
jgi:hypothetical protein